MRDDDDYWSGSADLDDTDADDIDQVEPDGWAEEPEQLRFGQVLAQDGLSEKGNTVAYSTSYNEYYDTVTGEEVEPK
ncbi:hypothetical protein [Acrocarpospora sp. B8E8]|uniref:hypothetical protein n=1 Tax=Acrocarpospora sp. B8E8 TaxID=3153572 RepID=UPI00325E753D